MPEIDLAEVIMFIQEAHEEHPPHSGEEYWHHCVRVRDHALEIFRPTDPEIVNTPVFECACLIHDVVEDEEANGYTMDLIKDKYGPTVAEYVRWVTKPPLPPCIENLHGPERRKAKLELNQQHYHSLACEGPRASHMIKIADRNVNLWNFRFSDKRAPFRQFYLADTKNLIEEFRACQIRGIEFVEARLTSMTG